MVQDHTKKAYMHRNQTFGLAQPSKTANLRLYLRLGKLVLFCFVLYFSTLHRSLTYSWNKNCFSNHEIYIGKSMYEKIWDYTTISENTQIGKITKSTLAVKILRMAINWLIFLCQIKKQQKNNNVASTKYLSLLIFCCLLIIIKWKENFYKKLYWHAHIPVQWIFISAFWN